MEKLIFGLAFLFVAIPCQAKIIVVFPGSRIQLAIDYVEGGDTVIVFDGIYSGDGNRDIDFKGKAITVRSANGPENCIIDCEDTEHRGFYFHSGEDANSILSGFTIKRGFASDCGGGIFCAGSSPRIENCTVISNNATNFNFGDAYGGGIYCTSNSNPEIVECTISNNKVEGCDGIDFGMRGWNAYGGGIYAGPGSCPTVKNCIISNNESRGGYGWPDMSGFNGNGGYAFGGGICGSNLIIQNCILTQNTASGGDGAWGGDAFGGGIYCISAEGVKNCTIVNNKAIGGTAEAPYGRTGISWGGGVTDMGTSAITNCIVWGNTALCFPGIYGSPSVSYSDVQGGTPGVGMGNINTIPLFANPSNDDYHLQSVAGRWDPNSQTWVIDANTSPCIDAGDPNSDWTAELWPHGKRINMGAYGGTPQASMSLSGLGNIADLNNDDRVSFQDFAHLADSWQNRQVLLPEDLDRNGVVEFTDLAIFADNWLWP